MSLILDALRKLERDKDAREPGVVVVGSVPWGGGRSRRSRVLVLAATACLVLLAGAWWLLWKTPAPGAGAPATAPSLASPPAPRALPVPSPPTAAGQASSPVIAPSPRELALPAPGGAPEAGVEGPEPPAPVPPSASSDDVRLTAISQKDGRPVVLINDRLMFEGDSFDGVKVLRIGEAEVEVEVRGKRRTLRF